MGAKMQTIVARGVPSDEHPRKGGARNTPDWDGTRIFLETIRHGSFRSASNALNLSLNALRRRFDEFEHKCGVTLASRDAYGIHLTSEGQKIFAAAEKMETAYFDVVRARDQSEGALEGSVRLAITEGLGTFWIAPRLIEFQRAFPKLMVDMHCAMSPPDILRLEADVGVQLTRPRDKDIKFVKVGRLHTMPFAATSYVKTYGSPATVSEFAKHRIVLQALPQSEQEETFRATFPGTKIESAVVFRSNVGTAHYWSIAKGAGIGVLPTYSYAIGAPIVPIDIRADDDPTKMLRWHYDILLTYHPAADNILRVRRLIKWLRDAFSPKLYPWFADEFVHPNDMPLSMDGLPLANMFAGFSAKELADPKDPVPA
jgi:DNA-binding transcriptional LysR family regulator